MKSKEGWLPLFKRLNKVQYLYSSFLNLLYPPLCLHCERDKDKDFLFCSQCAMMLELIDPSNRCPGCFTESDGKSMCDECRQRRRVIYRMGAAFDYMGPAATIVKQMKYGDRPYLAKGAGAYLVAQLIRLDWPIPDLIIPVPLTRMHWWERGFNQAALLAKEVGEGLNCPVKEVLRRSSGDFSQAGLNPEQRRQLNSTSFSLIEGITIRDCCVLLIDDVMTTGSTLQQCAEVLVEGFPASIYALTVCKAID